MSQTIACPTHSSHNMDSGHGWPSVPKGTAFLSGCRLDILNYMDYKCSGRRTCEVRVSNIVDEIPDNAQPCPKDLRNYLEASYTCMKGE